MIPNTVLGLVVVALRPGYILVRIEERRRPRPTRSGLLETAELVVIGGLSSTLAFAAVTAIAVHAGWLDEKQLAKDSTAYLLSHASRSAAFVLVTLALSYVATWLGATVLFSRRPANIQLYSGWDEVFKPKQGIVHYLQRLNSRLLLSGKERGVGAPQRQAAAQGVERHVLDRISGRDETHWWSCG